MKQRTALLVISIFLLSFIPVEVVSLLEFKTYISTNATIAILVTTLDEALGFTKGREIGIAGCVLGLLIWALALVKCPNGYLLETSKEKRVAAWAVLIALTFVVMQFFYYSRATDYSGKGAKYFIKQHIIKEYPVNQFYRFYEIGLIRKNLANQKRLMARFKFDSRSERPADERQVCVFIIGESGRYENYGFNGYGRDTTPTLSKTENLVVFPDYFSCANFTTAAVPFMMTRGTPRNPRPCLEEPSVVSLYREAGFATYWISSHDSLTGTGMFLYKNEADHFVFVGGQDEGVIPVLKQILSAAENRKFIVISLKGNHYGRGTYPKAFERFRPSIEDYAVLPARPENREYFVNSYDNSVLYQDFVLSKIIESVRACDAVSYVWFSPDHGESLFDTPLHLYGHGSPQAPIEQIHIPVFVWLSEQYMQKYRGTYDALLKNRTKKLFAGNSFYTVADLGGIGFKLMVPELSAASDRFVQCQHREVYLDGEVIPVD